MGFVFGLGCFPTVDGLWGVSLSHTPMLGSMLSCVGVGDVPSALIQC